MFIFKANLNGFTVIEMIFSFWLNFHWIETIQCFSYCNHGNQIINIYFHFQKIAFYIYLMPVRFLWKKYFPEKKMLI